MPTFKDLISFLEQRAIIESSHSFQRQSSSQKQDPISKKHSDKTNSKQTYSCNKTTVASNSKPRQVICPICSEQYTLLSCPAFHKMSPKDRYNEIKKTSFCHNCLKGYHRTIDCRAKTCEKCQGRHNVLLYFEKEIPTNSESSSS